MHRWMGAFPRHEPQPSHIQETIYEDWGEALVQMVFLFFSFLISSLSHFAAI